jgi:hypothetical protein
VDGEFGDELEEAVKAVQHGNGLEPNGVVDEPVWELLNRLVQGSSGSSSTHAHAGASAQGHSGDAAHAQGAGAAQSHGTDAPHAQGTGAAQTHGAGPAHAQGAAAAQPRPAGSIPVDPGQTVTADDHEYVIFVDEVRQGGSASWRARNPGNIRNGDSYGAYPGKKIHAGSSGEFAVFPDAATGFEAIKSVLRHYGHVTVSTAMSHYAPKGDGANDPDAYANHVAKQMGVPVTTYVDTLDDGKLDTFAMAIRQFEGWVPGHTFTLDDPTLPRAVKHAIHGN